MKQNSKQARTPMDEVELPFCEGLEIISASQLQQTPAVLTEAAPAQAAPPVREPHRPGPSDRSVIGRPHTVKPNIYWAALLFLYWIASSALRLAACQ